jgi:hypothetical protein
LIDREATMSNLTRTLIIGATLTAMHLVGMTAVAQATNEPTSRQDARRPPTEGQVGEAWRHPQIPAEQPTDALKLFRRGERAAQEQTAADATLQRVLDRERSSIPNATPTQAPAPVPAKPSGRPGWLVASLAVLVAALALSGGLAVLAAKRTRRRARLGHAA